MTTGYLWTGQFEEVQTVIDEGKPQSMELDENSLDGHWATNIKNDMEFFIINDAIFTKLCILGDDTEPCFEGASVTKPIVSSNFSKVVDDNFKKTLFSMINDLRDALKGGNEMAQEEKLPVEENLAVEDTVEDTFTQENVEPSEPAVSEDSLEATPEETFEASEENEEEPENDFKANEEEENKEEDSEEDSEEDKEDDDEKKYSLLEQQYNELSTQYEQLKAENEALVEFKNKVENEKKDALINDEFYMLSEEDKKDIIENKEKYSLDEIKAKLAVICFEKKVNFNSETSEEIETNKE